MGAATSGYVQRWLLAVSLGEYLSVAQLQRLLGPRGCSWIVCYHHDRPAFLVDFLEEPDDLIGRFRVEVAGGLVGQNDRRVVGKHPRQRDPLLLTDTQFRGLVVQPIAKSDTP